MQHPEKHPVASIADRMEKNLAFVTRIRTFLSWLRYNCLYSRDVKLFYTYSKLARSALDRVRWSGRSDLGDQGRHGVIISSKSHRTQVTRSTFVPARSLSPTHDVISRSDTLRSVSCHDYAKGVTPGRSISSTTSRALPLNDPFLLAFTPNSRQQYPSPLIVGNCAHYCDLVLSCWQFNLHESK